MDRPPSVSRGDCRCFLLLSFCSDCSSSPNLPGMCIRSLVSCISLGLSWLTSLRWLARKDRWEDCDHVLALVHSKGDRNAPFVLRELQEIKDMCEFERRNADVTYLELFKPKMINRTHIGVFTQIWSQLTGTMLISKTFKSKQLTAYRNECNDVLHHIRIQCVAMATGFDKALTLRTGMAGLSGNSNLVASSIQYVINVFMTIFALIYIDRWGRRWPLLIGATFMSIWMYANAGIMATHGKPAPPGGVDHVEQQSWQISGAPARAVIACTYLFVASFAPSWGPVSWVCITIGSGGLSYASRNQTDPR